MKAHIIPTVVDVTGDNIENTLFKIRMEFGRYDKCVVGKTNVTVLPICFDTETTTITVKDGDELAFIYIYQIQIGKFTFLIREREYILRVFEYLNDLCVDCKCNCYIAIANTKYEWSFMCKDLNELTDKEAKTDILFGTLEPLTANIDKLIIVDINRMTNSSLAKLGKDYCTTQKLKGDLDYKKIRNSKTPLTEKERAYCINDVVVGAEYMQFIHDRYTKQGKHIPLTATAFIRQIMQADAYTMDENGIFKYADTLNEIYEGFPTTYNEYNKIMNFLFRGGYTHGNLLYCGELLVNVEHIDYISDYPAALLQCKYPYKFYNNQQTFMYGKHMIIVKQLENETAVRKLLKYESELAFYFTATFTNIRKKTPHTLESTHKALDFSEHCVIDNGRFAYAEYLTVMLTEQDFASYLRMYDWDNMNISDLHIGLKKELPPYMINAIVTAYCDKKRLKDLKLPYAVEKALLNSVFGCTCQRIPIEDERDIITADDVIHIKSPVKFKYLNFETKRNVEYFRYIKSGILKHNPSWHDTDNLNKAIKRVYNDLYNGVDPDYTNKTYLTIYETVVEYLQQRAYSEQKRGAITKNKQHKSKILSPWFGIWCTAYARRRLCNMICDLEDWQTMNAEYAPHTIVAYYDTDSLFLNCHQSPECFTAVKSIIDRYNHDTEKYNVDNLRKYDSTGLLDDIGQFDWEKTATHFKQLGAKRYLQRYRLNVTNHKYNVISIHPTTTTTMMSHTTNIHVFDRYYIEATISGLNKQDFTNKINVRGGSVKDKFDFFTDGMFFDELETSKLVPTYITHPYSAVVTDEYGNSEIMTERCGQVLKPTPFKMQMYGLLLDKIHREG